VVSETVVAPNCMLFAPIAPTPPEPLNAMTVSD
jgi:hypothetical protein